MNRGKGNIISYLEWLAIEYFMEPIHSQLMSAARLEEFHDRKLFEEDAVLLENLVKTTPNFNKKKVRVFLN